MTKRFLFENDSFKIESSAKERHFYSLCGVLLTITRYFLDVNTGLQTNAGFKLINAGFSFARPNCKQTPPAFTAVQFVNNNYPELNRNVRKGSN